VTDEGLVDFDADGGRGCLRLRWHYEGFSILRADPVVLIDEQFLQVLIDGSLGQDGVRYGDGILTITAKNGTVSYGVGEPVPGLNARCMHRSNTP